MTQRVLEILINAFWRILLPGIKVTLPLTFFSFALAFVISVVVALIQYADVKILKQICRFYIWFIRGTPLLVQLYVVYYGLPQIGIMLDPVPAAIHTEGNTGVDHVVTVAESAAEAEHHAFIRPVEHAYSRCCFTAVVAYTGSELQLVVRVEVHRVKRRQSCRRSCQGRRS